MKTTDLSNAAEQIASIIQQRIADAIVDVALSFGTPEVSATWRRGLAPEVRLIVRSTLGEENAREAEVRVLWGATDALPARAATFARLMTDVAAIACEIEALVDGCVFTAGKV